VFKLIFFSLLLFEHIVNIKWLEIKFINNWCHTMNILYSWVLVQIRLQNRKSCIWRNCLGLICSACLNLLYVWMQSATFLFLIVLPNVVQHLQMQKRCALKGYSIFFFWK